MAIKICGITTRLGTAKVMFGNLKYSSERGFNCSVICQSFDGISQKDIEWGTLLPVPMNRGNVSPLEIIKVTYKLYKIFKREKYDIIQYASSNAGLYASIAGLLAKVPTRIFCQWGIPYVEYCGFKRWFFKAIERLTCSLSTSVQPDSLSNYEYAVSEGLYKREKGYVLGIGSAQGVDLKKFNINQKDLWREKIRSIYSIPEGALTFCFMGRIVPQKGINELLEAFIELNNDKVYLFVVGAPDEIGLLNQDILTIAKSKRNIIFTGAVANPEQFHASADFFVLPSYREGFPNTILEAGALAVPSIVTDINGMNDLVEDGVNGFLCKVKSKEDLFQCLKTALNMGHDEYLQMSGNIYNKVKKHFDSEYIKDEFVKNRVALFNNHIR